jgi:hypothetical protein
VIETISGSGRSLTIERSTIGGDEKPYDVDGQGSSIVDRVFFGTIGPSTPRIVIKNSIVFGNVRAPVQAEYSLLADVDPRAGCRHGLLVKHRSATWPARRQRRPLAHLRRSPE